MDKIKKSDKKSLDDYIYEKKWDIYVRFFLIILIVPFVFYFFPYIEMSILLLLCYFTFIIKHIHIYYNYKKIKKYLIKNNLICNIGDIVFCNDEHYFLTEKYMIIKTNKGVNVFNYTDIIKIYKSRHVVRGRGYKYYKYLYIVTNNNKYKILIETSAAVNEKCYDISQFLIEKNPNIVIDNDIKCE